MQESQRKLRPTEQIKFRLSFALAIVIFLVVISIAGLLTWNSSQRELAQQQQLLEKTAGVFSTSIAEPLANNSKRKIQQILTAIGKVEQFEYAKVSRANGSLYTEMGFGTHLTNQNALDEINTLDILSIDKIWINSDIRFAGERIGKLNILADVSGVRKQFYLNILLNIIMAAISAITAIILSVSVISKITNPLHKLSRFMINMGNDPDYSHRFSEEHKGELGVLSGSFNQMMGAIENRDNQIREYHLTLEDRIKQRTHDLEIAKNEAEEANAAKSMFLATVSHEIRTPMNGMMLMSELLASADLAPQQQRYANVIMKSGKSLLAIINDILDLSKIQSGNLELEEVEVSLEELVYDSMSLFTQMAADKGLELNSIVAPDVPMTFKGDPTRINQVLGNLVNNALKFTKFGSVTIQVSCFEEKGVQSIRFDVIDTGIGIKPENIEKVFDTYQQAESSTTRNYGGTGLGLSICRQLSQLMGGDISATSDYGEGSIFSFNFPLSGTGNCLEYSGHPDHKVLLILPQTKILETVSATISEFECQISHMDPGELIQTNIQNYNTIVSDLQTLIELDEAGHKFNGIALVDLGISLDENIQDRSSIVEIIEKPISSISVNRSMNRIFNGNPVRRSGSPAETAPETSILDFTGHNVLIADDSEVNREVIVTALDRFNITHKVVENGQQAIEAFEAARFDLILMDCNMPVVDGFEASQKIRQIEVTDDRPPTPIVALTAHRPGQIKQQVDQSGMNDVVVKPYTIKTIGSCLEKWLSADTKANHDNTIEIEPGTESEVTEEETPIVADASFDEQLLAGLKEIAGDAFEETMARLNTIYLDSAPGVFKQLEEAVSQSKLDDIAKSAHSLSSMSSNIGAGKLAENCRTLEDYIASGEQAQIGEWFYSINCEYLKVIDILSQKQASTEQSSAENRVA